MRPKAGLSIPEERWDRSDIFVVDELPGIRIVTEAFRQVIRKYRHTGVAFVPIDEWRDPLGWTNSKNLSVFSADYSIRQYFILNLQGQAS